MKNFKMIWLALMLFLVGCSVNESNEKEVLNVNSAEENISTKDKVENIDQNEPLSKFINGYGNLKLLKDELPEEYKNSLGEEKEYVGGYAYITKKIEEVKSFEEQVVFTKSDQIYPGAIFKGEAIQNNEYIPLNLPRKPINISISLQGNGEIQKEIHDPRVISSARETINELLLQENFEGSAALDFSVDTVNTANEFSMKLGTGVGIGAIKLGFEISPSTKFESSRTFAQFTQRFFSVGTDRPKYVADFFDEDITPEIFQEVSGGYMPVYVSNVIYGRRGIFELNTSSNTEILEKELTAGIKLAQASVDESLKDAVTSTIEEESLKLFLLGGNGDTAVQAVNSYEDFITHIEEGGKFSHDNRGEVIAFELRYLHDDSIAKTVIHESYEQIEKVPRNRTITLELQSITPRTESNSTGGNLKNMAVYVDQQTSPLWEHSNVKRGSSSQALVNTNTIISPNSVLPIDALKTHLTTPNAEARYYDANNIQIFSDNPETDTFTISAKINGDFRYTNEKGVIFGARSSSFSYYSEQTYNMKDFYEDTVIIFPVSNFEETPNYIFDLAVKVNVEFDELESNRD